MSANNSATTIDESNSHHSSLCANFDNDNDDDIPTMAALQQQQKQQQSNPRYAFLVDDDEEEETYDDDNIILNGEWDEEESIKRTNSNDLTTPLLARNNTNDLFMELEMSHETLKSLASPQLKTNKVANSMIQNNNNSSGNIYNNREQTKKQKRLTWDKATSNLKVQWHDSFNSFDDDDDEECNNNDHNLHLDSTTTLNNTNPNGDNEIQQSSNLDMNISIASVFLRDYEYSRPCSLSPNFDSITPIQLEMYNSRFSSSHQFLVCVAMITLFLASFFEGQSKNGFLDITFQILFTSFAVLIFTMDIVMRGYYDDDNLFTMNIPTLYTRKTRARKWKVPMLVMLMAVTLETAIKVLMNSNTLFVWSSMFKPIVFFYVSSKGRDGMSLFFCFCLSVCFFFVFLGLFDT
jgi:hypothetical protein